MQGSHEIRELGWNSLFKNYKFSYLVTSNVDRLLRTRIITCPSISSSSRDKTWLNPLDSLFPSRSNRPFWKLKFDPAIHENWMTNLYYQYFKYLAFNACFMFSLHFWPTFTLVDRKSQNANVKLTNYSQYNGLALFFNPCHIKRWCGMIYRHGHTNRALKHLWQVIGRRWGQIGWVLSLEYNEEPFPTLRNRFISPICYKSF